MDYLNQAVTWLYAAASLLIPGTMVVTLLAGEGGAASTQNWRQQCLKIGLYLSIILFLTGLLLPSFEAVFLEERASAAFDPKVLAIVLFSTRFGTVWMIQQGITLLLLSGFVLHPLLIRNFGRRPFLIFIIIATSLMLLTGSFKSHAAALEPIWPGLLGNSLHLMAAGAWLGGLPALFLLLRSSGQPTDHTSCAVIERTLRRFSILATTMVGVILFSGVLIGSLQISRWGELFSTPYGHLLLIKLALFTMMLCIAAIIRWRYMPRIATHPSNPINHLLISKWVFLETSIGIALLGVASILKETTPAAHEEVIIWPFNFRFSIDATWEESSVVRTQVTIGLCLLGAAMLLIAYSLRRRKHIKLALALGISLSIAGLATGLPPLSVEAYPDTYRNSTVPYIAVSIENGESLFRGHCVACHGESGEGDGILAKNLATAPANLTEPHTALHTAGDMFWWLTHGMGDDRVMPSFDAELDEDDMWDVINYLRAFSDGFTGRLLLTEIAPEQPFLGAPDFYYSTATRSGNLKDFRAAKSALLVFFSWPEDKERLNILKEGYREIAASNAEIIAIAMRGADDVPQEFINQTPFLIITQETQPITRTFAQYRRTFEFGGDLDNKDLPAHMEFTVDRFGYLRSRWIPEQTPGFWDAPSFLARQFSELAKEEEILPPPDEHIH